MGRKRLNNTDCIDKFIVEYDWVKKNIILKQPQIQTKETANTHYTDTIIVFVPSLSATGENKCT